MSKILERFREYPPLLRWVLIVAVVVIAFIVWNDIILDTAQRWKAQAAAYEREIERAAAGDRRMATQLKHTITSLGPVEPLSDEEDEESGKRELNEIINRVLSENSVANRDVNMKSAITFRNNELRRLIPPGGASASPSKCASRPPRRSRTRCSPNSKPAKPLRRSVSPGSPPPTIRARRNR